MNNRQLLREPDLTVLRDKGYYWVRRYGEVQLQVAHWTGLNWYLPGVPDLMTDDDMAQIGDAPL